MGPHGRDPGRRHRARLGRTPVPRTDPGGPAATSEAVSLDRLIAARTPALSVRQPWAWALIHGGKDVENRTWSTPYRGPLLIHAGKTPTTEEDWLLVRERWRWTREYAPWLATAETIPHPHVAGAFAYGAIIGHVRLVRAERNYPSEWAADGAWHWVVADPTPIDPPIPCRGQQGLFVPRL